MKEELIPQVGDVWKNGINKKIVLGVYDNLVWCQFGAGLNSFDTVCFIDFLKGCDLVERDGKPYVSVPQGEELIGMLCVVSDQWLESAKKISENISIISKYNNKLNLYTDITGTSWRYAYPVSKQQLLELAEKAK
jgi:hypothetical protein